MRNPLRGETAIDVVDDNGEVVKSHPIVYTVESLIWIEEATGCPPMRLLAKATSHELGMKELAVAVWAGMEAHRRTHGGPGRPLNPAIGAKVIEEAGGFMKVLNTVALAIAGSTALGLTDDVDEEEGDGKNPPSTGDAPTTTS